MGVLRLRTLEAVLDDPSVLFARRAVSTLVGLGLTGVALAGGIAFATWNVSDPSFTHATDAPVHNWMGAAGAAFADPLLQMFGFGALLLLLPLMIWGTRMMRGRPLGLSLAKVLAGLGAITMVPALLDVLPVTDAWPLPSGLGGIVGTTPGAALENWFGVKAATAKTVASALVGLVGVALLVFATRPLRMKPRAVGVGYQVRRAAPLAEEDEYGLNDSDAYEDEPSALAVMCGAIAHRSHMLRRKMMGARLKRPVGRNARTPREPRLPREAVAPTRPLRSALGAAPDHRPGAQASPLAAAAAAPAAAAPQRRVPKAPDHQPHPQNAAAAQAAGRPRRLRQAAQGAPSNAATIASAPLPGTPVEQLQRTERSSVAIKLPLRGPASRIDVAAINTVAEALGQSVETPTADTDRPAQEELLILNEPAAPASAARYAEAVGAPEYDDGEYWDEDDASERGSIHNGFRGDTYGAPYDPEAYAAQHDDFADEDRAPAERDGWDDEDAFAHATSAYTTQAPPPAPRRVTSAVQTVKPGRRVALEAQPSFLTPTEYEFPPLALLAAPPAGPRDTALTEDALEANARVLEGVLDDFGVKGSIIEVRPCPVVTLYELEPAPGIKSSRVIGLADDIARSMSAISARVAVIPGKNAIGIELPNETRITVFLRELLASHDFERTKGKLPMCLGKNIGGEAVIADLARMPHLLVAGTTGSGKSVSINTMILSLLYFHKPENCRIILIDPKMLELSVYDDIPHLLTPVVTDPKKAVSALRWAVREMEDRYRKMAKLGVRNIDGFNARIREAMKTGEPLTRLVQTGFDKATGEAIFEEERFDLSPIPFIVVIVDEMADLMMVAGKDIEGAIQRLAQMARAAGIHLIMATQRPSVDVITGTIKANFPTRISFQVTSKIDSRTILGEMGAEQLLGMGDMLFMAGGGRIQRVHGPFVSDEEVEEIVAHLKRQGVPEYKAEVLEDDEEEGGESGQDGLDALSESDDLYDRAVALVLRDRKASTSYIQRRLSIGYNRAATLIERMENEGVVGAPNHAGKREILVPDREAENA
ncbi:MAG: DNA translocase FtsK 4TM domain-containing protein [Pseudomonadota bacterium]